MKTVIESARIKNSGMGGFLNPPTHPEHTMSIETDLRRKPDNRGSMSLSYALTVDYISTSIKERVKDILSNWDKNKPALDTPEVKKWIYEVLGYFNNCYSKDGNGRNVSTDMDILNVDPFESNIIDRHLGVMHIREFYPEYMPTHEDFAKRHWGNK